MLKADFGVPMFCLIASLSPGVPTAGIWWHSASAVAAAAADAATAAASAAAIPAEMPLGYAHAKPDAEPQGYAKYTNTVYKYVTNALYTRTWDQLGYCLSPNFSPRLPSDPNVKSIIAIDLALTNSRLNRLSIDTTDVNLPATPFPS